MEVPRLDENDAAGGDLSTPVPLSGRTTGSTTAAPVTVQHALRRRSAGITPHWRTRRVWLTPTTSSICARGRIREGWQALEEWLFTQEFLRTRPEAQAVVHTHADCCVALSCLRKPIPPFHYMIASFGGNDIPCSRYEPFGSPGAGEVAIEAINGTFRVVCWPITS